MALLRRIFAAYLVSYLALCGFGAPSPLLAQEARPGSDKELVAVMDLGMLDGTKAQGNALTNQLRSEVLKTGRVTLVDRSQMDRVLEEQALQQTGCTTEECAVDVGKILGIRKIVTGSITKVSEGLWQVSVQMIDVETSETVKAETFNHRGNFEDLLFTGMKNVAVLLFPAEPRSPQAVVEATRPPAPAPAAPAPAAEEDEGGVSWWVWLLLGLGVAGAAVALSGGGGGGGGGGGDTGSVEVAW